MFGIKGLWEPLTGIQKPLTGVNGVKYLKSHAEIRTPARTIKEKSSRARAFPAGGRTITIVFDDLMLLLER